MHLVSFTIEIYHDARPYEHKVTFNVYLKMCAFLVNRSFAISSTSV
jgi:hypothetical protein